MGVLIVISGPSGAGKGTLRELAMKNIPKDQVAYSISCTTRPKREGEQNGVEYWFLTDDQFKNKIDQNLFLEWAHVHGKYYGTSIEDVDKLLKEGRSVILEIDVQGAMQVKTRRPDAVMIFIAPPNLQELKERLLKRGTETPQTLSTRMQNAENEMSFTKNYDYIIVNDDVQKAAKELENIIKSLS